MRGSPFTVHADLELGTRVASYLTESDPDVVISEGSVPDSLGAECKAGVAYQVSEDRFLLHVPSGVSYLVESGDRVTYRRNGASDREVALFLLGSAWGALCYQRDLLPLHASAVIHEGVVHAFTGISGTGKSTLAAALAHWGLRFFSDDVLIIDHERIGNGEAVCYSGQKDMKLWSDGLELTGAKKLGAVRDVPDFDKFFAEPTNGADTQEGRLATLSILKNENVRRGREPIEIEAISGGLAIKQLRDSVYRLRFAKAIWGQQRLFAVLAKLIAAVCVHTFDRPLAEDRFEESTKAMAEFIAGWKLLNG